MRRVLLLCLLFMLPFQGAWGVAAGIAAFDAPCAASQPAAGHGDHGGQSDASADVADAGVDCNGGLPVGPCCDGTCSNCSNCSACQGHRLVALFGVPNPLGGTGTAGRVPARCARGAPDHVPEQPLKPPLLRLA